MLLSGRPNSLEVMDRPHVPGNAALAGRFSANSAEHARATVHRRAKTLGGMTVVFENPALDAESAP